MIQTTILSGVANNMSELGQVAGLDEYLTGGSRITHVSFRRNGEYVDYLYILERDIPTPRREHTTDADNCPACDEVKKQFDAPIPEELKRKEGPSVILEQHPNHCLCDTCCDTPEKMEQQLKNNKERKKS